MSRLSVLQAAYKSGRHHGAPVRNTCKGKSQGLSKEKSSIEKKNRMDQSLRKMR